MTTWTSAIIEYGTALRARGLSKHTQMLYQHYLNHAGDRLGGDLGEQRSLLWSGRSAI